MTPHRQNATLHALDLACNQIGDQGTVAFSGALRVRQPRLFLREMGLCFLRMFVFVFWMDFVVLTTMFVIQRWPDPFMTLPCICRVCR